MMRTRSRTGAYSVWRQAQEWLGEWLRDLARGRSTIPKGAAIRRAIGLRPRATLREVESRLRVLAAEPIPTKGDVGPSLERLARVRQILSESETGAKEAESSFSCAFCGESTPIEVDPEDGETQSFTVDCSVCCRPNVVRLSLSADGAPCSIDAMPEQA